MAVNSTPPSSSSGAAPWLVIPVMAGVVAVLVLSLAGETAQAPEITAVPPTHSPTMTDVEIERVRGRLADGRLAMATFTLRVRDDDGMIAAAIAGIPATPRPTRIAPVEAPPEAYKRIAGHPKEDKTSERVPPALASMREEILRAMGGLTYAEVSGSQGMERLKQAVRLAVNAELGGDPVESVFVRDFIVQ